MTTDQDAPTDRELLAQVAEGDRGALHSLFTRHQPWLAARVRQRCSDPAIVAEVVNDTFLKVWQQPTRYSGDGEVAAWLWGIAIRTLLHQLRPRKPLLDRLRQLRHDHVPSAEEAVLLRVEHSDVGQALQKLSPELLAVVQATVIDGLSTREAGELLVIPSGTVKSRMSRARLELREALL
ncbi:RNA polymerase sigma factor [Ornithinimicrobium humiphilum]|uniref:RNA polymerase sigma-70 factor (ECF subfamily) n=1 Tax=Ornithinimicrobium humiphilum TaxID=125288 RepID=A0A543KPS4_9MICO|nr:RNA polymerase sigma factor [Ornithinimicrobium humiphilum]TQM97085.1 RNA polymerase sigma-70 factor (ECF subfamily) [Ornithinimicrobium humiphilum]